MLYSLPNTLNRKVREGGSRKVRRVNAEGILCVLNFRWLGRRVNAFGILRELCVNSLANFAVKCRRMARL
jgi:hypothetical protein